MFKALLQELSLGHSYIWYKEKKEFAKWKKSEQWICFTADLKKKLIKQD